ncbi:unnamed protein product [Lymnaea stagnalis]|uniref:Mitochondrial ribosomal protein S36 n=1 Tax=Lymnaea stagnalis TaxID=6523 RepID=A0AAV2HI07_LYMST
MGSYGYGAHFIVRSGFKGYSVSKKAVRPHVPLIKFPSRGSTVKNPVDAVSTSAGKVELTASGTKKTTTVTRQTIDSSQLPLKYRRKPLTNEEIEIIEKGGRL